MNAGPDAVVARRAKIGLHAIFPDAALRLPDVEAVARVLFCRIPRTQRRWRRLDTERAIDSSRCSSIAFPLLRDARFAQWMARTVRYALVRPSHTCRSRQKLLQSF